MYTIHDRTGFECFQKCAACLSKVGEMITLVASNAGLELRTTNTSKSVVTTCRINNSVVRTQDTINKTVQIKSKVFDLLFSRFDKTHFRGCTLRFGTTSHGAEFLEVRLDTDQGISKVYQIECLDNLSPVPGPIDDSGLYEFAVPTPRMKAIVAHSTPAAEEAELSFKSGSVIFRSYREKGRIDRETALLKKVDTLVQLQLAEFESLHVQVPWRASFRLKEFRTMVNFSDQMNKEGSLTCSFGPAGDPLNFTLEHPLVQCSIAFTFNCKGLSNQEPTLVVNVANGNVRVDGVSSAPSFRSSRPSSFRSARGSHGSHASRDSTITVIEGNLRPVAAGIEKSVRRGRVTEITSSSRPPSDDNATVGAGRPEDYIADERTSSPCVTDDQQTEVEGPFVPIRELVDCQEVAMTQDAAPVRGLFD